MADGSGRVLVTGGAGMIGRRLVRHLARGGYEVVVLDLTGPRSEVARRKPELRSMARDVRWIRGDTRKESDVREAMAGVGTVFHLAAGPSFVHYSRSPVAETSNAITGFLTVLDAARHAGVRRVVHASTSAVYEGNPVPYREDMPLSPPDLKSLAKRTTEDIAGIYAARYGMTTISLRPFSVYSDDETEKGPLANVVSLFVWAVLAGRTPVLWGDGRQTRDFVYVDDVARAFALAAEVPEPATQPVNVGTGVETTHRELVRLIAAACGVEAEFRFSGVPVEPYANRLLADTTRAEKVLGFRAETALAAGVAKVVEQARASGSYGRAVAGLALAQEPPAFSDALRGE